MTVIKLWSAVGGLVIGIIVILYPFYSEASWGGVLFAFLFGAVVIGGSIIAIRKLWRELKKRK